jgi:hypothetical protein
MKTIKLTAAMLAEFANYIVKCINSTIIIDSKTFTDLLHFHLQNIKHKLHVKSLEFEYKHRNLVTVRLDYAEQITLSYVFKQHAITPLLLGIEFTVTGGL